MFFFKFNFYQTQKKNHNYINVEKVAKCVGYMYIMCKKYKIIVLYENEL